MTELAVGIELKSCLIELEKLRDIKKRDLWARRRHEQHATRRERIMEERVQIEVMDLICELQVRSESTNGITEPLPRRGVPCAG